MREEDAEFLAAELESFAVGGQQVDEQHRADRVASRKDREAGAGPIDQKTFKIEFLRPIESLIDLRDRPDENQDDGYRQAEHRQFQGRQDR